MKKEKKIYVVTAGCYSDYHICAIFSTKEFAEKYIKINGGDNPRIEEYEINAYNDLLNKNYKMFTVFMDKDGNSEIRVNEYLSDQPNHVWFFKAELVDKLGINVIAKNEKHAIKIVNEKRIQLIANEMWGKSDF